MRGECVEQHKDLCQSISILYICISLHTNGTPTPTLRRRRGHQGGQVLNPDPLVREQGEDLFRPYKLLIRLVSHRRRGINRYTYPPPSPFHIRGLLLPSNMASINPHPPLPTDIHHTHLRTLRYLPPARKGKHHRAHLRGQALPLRNLLPQRPQPLAGRCQVSVPFCLFLCGVWWLVGWGGG